MVMSFRDEISHIKRRVISRTIYWTKTAFGNTHTHIQTGICLDLILTTSLRYRQCRSPTGP